MRYIVKSVVCDYGVFEKTDNGEQLKVICDSLSNAELIADILNTDLENTKYKAIKPTKIDKAIEKIVFLRQHRAKYITEDYKICIDSGEVLKILQECIGE